MRDRTLRVVQYLLMTTGVVLLGSSVLAVTDRVVSSRQALAAFDEVRSADAADSSRAAGEESIQMALATPEDEGDEAVDFSLWSERRIREYKARLSIEKGLPWAVLAIDRLRIRAPVFDGTDDSVLNRGLGWIAGTGRPGGVGNVGIAGHRDSFFRALKDISAGDAIELTTLDERLTYVVDEIEIVSPDDVHVLQARSSPSLTLVTCYPFYFIGDAPQRFIVHATLNRSLGTTTLRGAGAKSD